MTRKEAAINPVQIRGVTMPTPEPFEAGRQHGEEYRVKKADQDGDGDVGDRSDNQS